MGDNIIVIVGNGFDVNHGLTSGYASARGTGQWHQHQLKLRV